MSAEPSDFSQANQKLMATALFFEYVAYAVFNIYDSIQKQGPEYLYINEQAAEIQKAKDAEKK